MRASSKRLPPLDRLDDPVPHSRLLSNGRYTVLFSGAGSGFSSCAGTALTGWSADRTEDREGLFFYLRDVDLGVVWSVGHQPTCVPARSYRVRSHPGSVALDRLDHQIGTRLEVCVDAENDLEVRRLRLSNRSRRPRTIELTCYLEVVLQTLAAHRAHPAFSKLFIQTEFEAESEALLASRRPRGRDERRPWLALVMTGRGTLAYETDRARFVGRGADLVAPMALSATAPLASTTGNVLDPVFALRRTVRLRERESATFHLALAFGWSRPEVLRRVASAARPSGAETAFRRAAARERRLRRRLRLTADRAERLQALVGGMLYRDPRLRAEPETLRRCGSRPIDLGSFGLRPGALRIVALPPRRSRSLLRSLTVAREYWRALGLEVDALILDRDRRSGSEKGPTAGAIVTRCCEGLDPADLDALLASADLVLRASSPESISPVARAARRRGRPAYHRLRSPSPPERGPKEAPLEFDNGYGGFTAQGREYVVRLDGAQGHRRPPLPWANVVANPGFGFLATESGAGTTWSENSRENRLTPWSNDPVIDPHGEALYVRDEAARSFWSLLPGPAADGAAHEARHGFGYSRWRHASADLDQEVVSFVPVDDPVKISLVTLRNRGDRRRRLSLFSFQRLILGSLPAATVVTEFDVDRATLIARNPRRREVSEAVTFATAIGPRDSAPASFTTDRCAFVGRNGSLAQPASVAQALRLDGRLGAGLDPCFALQRVTSLGSGETARCAFVFGEAPDRAAVQALVDRYRRPGVVGRALEAARAFWSELLSRVEVKTPVPAIDRMLNGWLLYQVLSCRVWGRSAFYQSGGAFGFRDQLQDSAALVYTRPDLTRAQILLHAAHQFVEGDVLHWWHPPSGRGTRTRCSDDRLWLPYVTTFYAQTTGDWSVFDETVGFVESRGLGAGEDETLLQPSPSGSSADVYEHCCRAIDRSLTSGPHGLPLIGTCDWNDGMNVPLIGTCDWNDGMNRVGRRGRGESVWLGFFLAATLDGFLPLCVRRGDRARAERYRAYRRGLGDALESAGWDGAWYRRAYYDDGTPLGSAASRECRIDVLAQAWAVISNAAPRDRAAQAMEAAERELVSEREGIVRLLAPPFDRAPEDPGYIKGYVPGVRENGGQYTHGALWLVKALAELGRNDRAARLLEMLTPIHHSRNRQEVETYQVEPYVVAADVYGADPHVGRGGWTWYTGSAGWMYRVAIESILGLTLEEMRWLRLRPCIPDDWEGFSLAYRLPGGDTRYEISVENPTRCAHRVVAVDADGHAGEIDSGGARIPLLIDGRRHVVRVVLGAAAPIATPSSSKR